MKVGDLIRGKWCHPRDPRADTLILLMKDITPPHMTTDKKFLGMYTDEPGVLRQFSANAAEVVSEGG
tara:strand:+ start:716 stop:916 length:201 start_codon:yes stop_codon:yes gene_type:complete